MRRSTTLPPSVFIFPILAVTVLAATVSAQPTLTGGALTSGVPVKFTLGPITSAKLYGNWTISVPATANLLKIELSLSTPNVAMDLYASVDPVILTNLGGGYTSTQTRCGSSARPSPTTGYAMLNVTTGSSCGLGMSRYVAIIMYTTNVTADVTVTATTFTGAPELNSGGVTNAASFAAGAVAPGGLISVFGANMAASTQAASSMPLPMNMGGTSFLLGGQAVPIFYVSGLQANLQVPWELGGQSQALMSVTSGSVTGALLSVSLVAVNPGIFTVNQSGKGQGAITIASSGEFAAPSGSIPGQAARPVARGEYLSIYCTGLGAVTNQPASGARSPVGPMAETILKPTVTIGGVAAPVVSFSGLAPGFVALYQVNVQVPQTAPTGDAIALVLSVGAAASNSVTVAVK